MPLLIFLQKNRLDFFHQGLQHESSFFRMLFTINVMGTIPRLAKLVHQFCKNLHMKVISLGTQTHFSPKLPADFRQWRLESTK